MPDLIAPQQADSDRDSVTDAMLSEIASRRPANDRPDRLIDTCAGSTFTYAYCGRVGDGLIREQRAAQKRGAPQPGAQPKAQSSICVTISDAGGLEEMRRPL